jgi:hypothetical protein
MRPIVHVIVLLSGFLLFSPSSYAGVDGNSLLEECAVPEKLQNNEKTDDVHKRTFCLVIVDGV